MTQKVNFHAPKCTFNPDPILDQKWIDMNPCVQELVTNVQFANDEGDPGMGLELGLNAFAFGGNKGFIIAIIYTGVFTKDETVKCKDDMKIIKH